MPDDTKWPMTFERIRGHWIGMVFGLVAAGVTLAMYVGKVGWSPAGLLAFLYGFLAYWFWRAIDYTGWRFMSRYLPRR